MAAVKRGPVTPPKTAAESKAMLTKLMQAYDESSKAFLEKYSNDRRRWKINLFEAEYGTYRTVAGLPSKGSPKTLLEEILKAPDADMETKGDADGMLVFRTASAAQSSGKTDEWIKQAEAHLKAYPKGEYNQRIESEIASIKVLADLKTKPMEIKFTAVDGREVDLSKMRGKVVLIDFWATWCGPCVQEVPNVVKAYEKLHPKGFEIIGISLDRAGDKAKLESFTKEHAMPWPQYFDGKYWENEISTRYGIHSIPAMWLVDKKGMMVSTEARGSLEREVEKLLNQ